MPTADQQLPEPIDVHGASHEDAAALAQLWTLFRHDMSASTGELPDSLGRYRAQRLENALTGRPGWEAWLMTAGSHPVAFAVARALNTPEHVLSSLFVVIPARRVGAGTVLASTVLANYPGYWRVAHQDANEPAARFWPHVAGALDPDWRRVRRPVPGRPDLPPDTWIDLTVSPPDSTGG